jgi:hypothetical protein
MNMIGTIFLLALFVLTCLALGVWGFFLTIGRQVKLDGGQVLEAEAGRATKKIIWSFVVSFVLFLILVFSGEMMSVISLFTIFIGLAFAIDQCYRVMGLAFDTYRAKGGHNG